MALLDYTNYIADDDTPYDLAYMRRQVLEYHKAYGMPAIFKRAWGIDDIALGNAQRDNTYEDAYGQSLVQGDVEGTGYSEDGALTYITLDDTMIDDESPSERGAYKLLQPVGVAPWAPLIKDGDLMILVEIEEDELGNITITNSGDRFRVQNVQPITERGFKSMQRSISNYMEKRSRFVSQRFQATRIPRSDPAYDVPVT